MRIRFIILLLIIVQTPLLWAQDKGVKMQFNFKISFGEKNYDVSSNLVHNKDLAADPQVNLALANYETIIIKGNDNLNYISENYERLRIIPDDTLIFYCYDRDNFVDDLITTIKIPSNDIITKRQVIIEQDGHKITIESNLYQQALLTQVTFVPDANLSRFCRKTFKKKGLQWIFDSNFESEIKHLTDDFVLWDVSYEFEALLGKSFSFTFKSHSKTLKIWTTSGPKSARVKYNGGETFIKTSYGTFYLKMAPVTNY